MASMDEGILNLAGFYGELKKAEGTWAIEIKRDVVAFKTSGDLAEAGWSVFRKRKIYERRRGLESWAKIDFVFGLVERNEAQLDASVGGRPVEGDVEEQAGNGDQKDGALTGVSVILQRRLSRLDIEVSDSFGRDGAIFLELRAVTGADHPLAGAFHAADDATLMRANGTDDIKIVGVAAIDNNRLQPRLVGSVVGGDGSRSETN